MSNTKTILNLVISIIASILAAFAIIYFANEPLSLTKSLGICTAAGLFLAVVEFFIIGFSSYIERYPSIFAFTFGFGINIIVSAVMMFMHIPTLWQALLGSFLIGIFLLLLHLLAFILGTIRYCKRNLE